MSFFSQIVSFVQERLGPSLGQGTVSEPGRFSAPSLLKEFHGKRLDPQIYDNALRILNLSDDLSVVKIEEQLQYISTSLKKKRISVSAPLALIFDEMIRDVEMAYKTVMAGPPSRSAECTSLILYGPTARKPVGLLKAISEKPSYNLLRTPEEISSVVKTYFPNAEVWPDVHNGFLLGVAITKITPSQPPLFVHSALDGEAFMKILKQLQAQIALGKERGCEEPYPVEVSSFSSMVPLEEKGYMSVDLDKLLPK